MPRRDALIVFFRTPEIDRTNPNDPFSTLPWEDIDSLFTAMNCDFIRNASQLTEADILLYRNPLEISDDFFLPFRQKTRLFELNNTHPPAQMQRAIESAYLDGYQNVVVMLDNNPLISKNVLNRVFVQLGYEDDCLVVGPTASGKCYLVGMKTNHASIFDGKGPDVLNRPHVLLKNICGIDSMVFLLSPMQSADTSVNLMKLMTDIDELDRSAADFPGRTHGAFKTLSKKYKLKKIFK